MCEDTSVHIKLRMLCTIYVYYRKLCKCELQQKSLKITTLYVNVKQILIVNGHFMV